MGISEKIKDLRSKHNLSAKELGDKIGVSGANIYAYEKGRAVPPLTKIELLAKVFNVKKEYFISDENVNLITNSNEITKQESYIEMLRINLGKLQGYLIGKYGLNDWQETEQFFPKCRQVF
jgi:transcriptional regulator with XRE-family HTH domain